jgi:hypothetical protein
MFRSSRINLQRKSLRDKAYLQERFMGWIHAIMPAGNKFNSWVFLPIFTAIKEI